MSAHDGVRISVPALEALADRLRGRAAEIEAIAKLCAASGAKLRGLGHGLREQGQDSPANLAEYEGKRLQARGESLAALAADLIADALRIETIRTVLINRADAEVTRPILMRALGFGGETGSERCDGGVPGDGHVGDIGRPR